eukprot:5205145-Pyramimonas_sp.AAC.1
MKKHRVRLSCLPDLGPLPQGRGSFPCTSRRPTARSASPPTCQAIREPRPEALLLGGARKSRARGDVGHSMGLRSREPAARSRGGLLPLARDVRLREPGPLPGLRLLPLPPPCLFSS